MLMLFATWPELVDHIALIERRLGRALQAAARAAPDAPATQWRSLYEAWGELVPLLERHQAALRHAVADGNEHQLELG